MPVDHIADLRREIANGRVTCLVGAGVSMAATFDPARQGPNVASWLGLLEHGIDRCVAVVPSLPTRWREQMRGLLDLGREGDTESLLAVAEAITVKLGGPAGAEMRRWLRETLGSFKVTDPAVPRALGALGVPLLTTNYDDVLEDANGLRALDWKDTADMERVLRGEDRAIVHVHGYWRRPENVILGVRSYEDILRAAHVQAGLRALRMTKTLLYVGFGGGLDDPNFGALLRWAREVAAGSEYRHYRLARNRDVAWTQGQHPPEDRIFVIGYGEEYADLGPFLEQLAPKKSAVATGAPAAVVASALPRSATVASGAPLRPRILIAGPWFGVPKEMRAEIERIWREEPPSKALAVIRSRLGIASLRRAQIAAALRYDVILDLSPWRAFASRWSLGLRDVEREPGEEVSPRPLLYMAWPDDFLPLQGDLGSAALSNSLEALRDRFPHLATRIDALAGEGIAIAGFSPPGLSARDVSEWLGPISRAWPDARWLSNMLTSVPHPRALTLTDTPLDAPAQDPSLDDYLRALRITAGQVTLAGETSPRPILDVYVDLEIQREEERRKESAPLHLDDRPEVDRASSEALRDEIEARRKAAWDVPGSEVLPASAIHEVARRILLWGPAGTGKSTLLRFLACKVADEGRIPLWLPRLVDLDENFAETLVERALEAVELPTGPSPARAQLREAVETGHVFLFLDGFDEARPEVRKLLPNQIRDLPPETRVVLASRPLHRMHTPLKEITLTGLPVTGAEEMLRAYFKDADWIEALLHDLDALPDGMMWMRNPVLLGLAASIYQQERALPDATLDLYGQVIRKMLRAPWNVAELLPALQAQARRMLAPTSGEGEAKVTVRQGELPYEHRDAMLASGLFTGDDWLRFTHLTLGEYLAAGAEDYEVAAQRRREKVRPEGRAEDETALDVLAMAHALRGEDALEEALGEAREDTPGHRMLRLVLRAVGYGGEAVRGFCTRRGEELLGMLAARMQMPSGRFGDFERLLMEDAERATLVLRKHVQEEAAKRIEARFAPVLATSGEAGTEAHVALWNLGVRKPERRESRWSQTILRQARALSQARLGVNELVLHVEGYPHSAQAMAVRVLGKYEKHRPALWPLMERGGWLVAAAVIETLKDDVGSEIYIRERITDDSGLVRQRAVTALGGEQARRQRSLARLIACLNDRHEPVRFAAAKALRSEPAAWPILRSIVAGSLGDRKNFVRDAAVVAIASDPESEDTLHAFLVHPDRRDVHDSFAELAKQDKWRVLLQERLYLSDADPAAIMALAGDSLSRGQILRLLNHSKNADVVAAAATASGSNPEALSLILKRIEETDSLNARCACIRAAGAHPEAYKHLRKWLIENNQAVQCAAIEALSLDTESLDTIGALLYDREHNVRLYAVRALAGHPKLARERLWGYFSNTANESGADRIAHDYLRAAIVSGLARDDASKDHILAATSDYHAHVRRAALTALAQIGAPREVFLKHLADDSYDVQGVAFAVLGDDVAIRERLLPYLQESQGYLSIAGLRMLAKRGTNRDQIRPMLRHGSTDMQSAAAAALAIDPASRAVLREHVSNSRPRVLAVLAHFLQYDPEVRRLLRHRFLDKDRIVAEFHDFVFEASWAEVGRILASDPEAGPMAHKLLLSVSDDNVRIALMECLALYPPAHDDIRKIVSDPSAPAHLRAGAIKVLTGDAAVIAATFALMDHESADLRAAAISAASDVAESKPRIRKALQTDKDKNVRLSALRALKGDVLARSLLTSLVATEPDDDIRNEMVAELDGLAEAAPYLRQRLSDPASSVRNLAARGLRPQSTEPTAAVGVPLARLPLLRIAFDIAGSDPTPAVHLPSPLLRDRLEAFLRSPRPLHLDADPRFADALLGYLLARLCWASEDGAFGNGRIFGEVEHLPATLLAQDKPLIIRVAMDSSELPRERFLHPSHNLIEAWNVATHLSARTPPAFFLACADVAFEHLVPPDLAPGEVSWGPGFFGFRLRRASAEPLDPVEWLVSSEARDVWFQADGPTRARYLETLTRLANVPSLDPWSVLPVLSRVGDLLPHSIQSAFAERLPRAMSGGALYVERAARSLGAAVPAAPLLALPPAAAPPELSPGARLQEAIQEARALLRGDGPIEHAVAALETSLPFLISGEIPSADLDNAAMALGGLRNRLATADQAKRVLAVATAIDENKLSRAARRGLRDFLTWLRTWRIA